MIKQYIELLRPHHYIKNFFIFMPAFFALKFDDMHILLKNLFIFIAFSMVASAIYIFNDLFDIENDRKHPTKKNRPLVTGAISKKSAIVLMLLLLSAGLSCAFFINKMAAYVFIGYIAMNLLYSFRLKRLSLVDIFIVATGFVLRLFIGSYTSNIELSMWIIIMTFLLALFLALAKRRDDVLLYIEKAEKTRRSLDGYNLDLLNGSIVIMAPIIVVSYIMYTTTPAIIKHFSTDKLYLTAGWVLLGILRYMQITFVEKNSGNPVTILLKDRFLQVVMLSWITSFGLIIYL